MKKQYWIWGLAMLTAAWFVLILPLKTLLGGMGPTPGFRGESPFGHIYRIPETTTLVRLNQTGTMDYLADFSRDTWIEMGTLEYQNSPDQQEKHQCRALWELIPEQAPMEVYHLTVENDDSLFLACIREGKLEWKRPLTRVDTLFCTVKDSVGMSSPVIRYFPKNCFNGDLSHVNTADVKGEGTISIGFRRDSPNSLTVIEEYHGGDTVETVEHILQIDAKKEFTLPVTPRAGEPGRYILYRIPFENGEYIFGVQYN